MQSYETASIQNNNNNIDNNITNNNLSYCQQLQYQQIY